MLESLFVVVVPFVPRDIRLVLLGRSGGFSSRRPIDLRRALAGLRAPRSVRRLRGRRSRGTEAWPRAAAVASTRPQDSLAEWSKALASGASPQGHGFEPHSCHSWAPAPGPGACRRSAGSLRSPSERGFAESGSPATRNRTRDHLIAARLYSQMLCQLSYSRRCQPAGTTPPALGQTPRSTAIVLERRQRPPRHSGAETFPSQANPTMGAKKKPPPEGRRLLFSYDALRSTFRGFPSAAPGPLRRQDRGGPSVAAGRPVGRPLVQPGAASRDVRR